MSSEQDEFRQDDIDKRPRETNTEELKPCPFCGGEAELRKHGIHIERWYVRCKRNGCNYTYNDDEKPLAIKAWNTRQAQPKPEAKCKTCEDTGCVQEKGKYQVGHKKYQIKHTPCPDCGFGFDALKEE